MSNQDQVQEQVQDPLAEAESAQPVVYTHWGQVHIVADFVVWPKGTRLENCPPYNPQQHSPDKKVTRVVVRTSPLPGQTHPFEHKRVVTNYSREWASVTNPSIQALGLQARDIIGKYAKYQFAKARTYTDRNGDPRSSTSFKFLEIYDDADAAREAADEFFNSIGVGTQSGDEIASEIPGFEDNGASDGGNGSDPERAALAQFLPALWAQAEQDPAQFAVKIAEMPMLAAHFDIDSPEVQAIVNGAS